jgi:hypothetical protein
MIVYVSIGNSDDRLTQAEWSAFCWQVDNLFHDVEKHGAWYSLPAAPWQNACWCVELAIGYVDDLQAALRSLARDYRQTSVAWAVAETEFLRP